MRDFLREMYKFVKALADGNPWVRRGLWAVCILAVAALAAVLWPRSPQSTVAHYLYAMQEGNCGRAWRLVSRQRREMMDTMASYDSFEKNICDPVSDAYGKIYYEPWDGERLDVFGGRAELKFCACALPQARARRLCAAHNAVLVRERLRWKILFLPVGPWDKEPCKWQRQKPEALIAPDSRHKNPEP